jgi:hypothetical protein
MAAIATGALAFIGFAHSSNAFHLATKIAFAPVIFI